MSFCLQCDSSNGLALFGLPLFRISRQRQLIIPGLPQQPQSYLILPDQPGHRRNVVADLVYGNAERDDPDADSRRLVELAYTDTRVRGREGHELENVGRL